MLSSWPFRDIIRVQALAHEVRRALNLFLVFFVVRRTRDATARQAIPPAVSLVA